MLVAVFDRNAHNLALNQVPNGVAVVGILLVVAAGIGAERTGARAAPASSVPEPVTA